MIRVLSRIKSMPWAIDQAAMNQILEIAERENETPQAVAAKLGRPLENTYSVEYRDGVAILPVTGPMFRYANLFTMLSGATSYDLLARDFSAAIADQKVKAVLLNIDSPGGEANGVSEFADMIYAARGTKPIVAYVGGQGASAAYWLASAADEVVVDETSITGSIGTVVSVQDNSEADAKAGKKRYDIVSSQSPDKRLDPSTDDGRAKMQVLVDSLTDVFVDRVARNRGTSRETVLSDYGKGGVFVGQAAVKAGLADRLGSFEAVVAELQGEPQGRQGSNRIGTAGASNQEVTMTEKTEKPAASTTGAEEITAASIAANHPDVAQALRAEGEQAGRVAGASEGAAAERARIHDILAHDEAKDRPALAQSLAFNTDMTVEAAAKLLAKAAKESKPSQFASFDAAMRNSGNPNVGADAEASDTNARPSDGAISTAKALGLAK